FAKKECLYTYKKGLHNIRKLDFDDEQKAKAEKLLSTYKADKKKCAELLKLHENKSGGNELSQGRKHVLEEENISEEEQTIIGGKSTTWVVNGTNIRHRLTQYQKTGLPKTSPEYYDVILFTKKSQDGFLKTLEENVVLQMSKDIEREDKEIKSGIEENIRLFLDNIIVSDIKRTKENLKLQNIDTFEKDFAVFFVNHMIELIKDGDMLLGNMSEGTFIITILAPILQKIFMKNKKIWRVKYEETCKANTEDQNSQTDNERHSLGKKIDILISLKDEDEEFSVTREDDFQGMTTRMVYSPKSKRARNEKTKSKHARHEKKTKSGHDGHKI
ncbi:6748_t:CDS:2, partial [Acaulospora colombiana]